ncbi:hypothetical protein ABPG72_011579 [Tetrahymena utriculariae]
MVKVYYRVDCQCGAWLRASTESGERDQWNLTFDCNHFTVEIYQATKLGFLFGGNAKVYLDYYPKCNKCGHKFSVYENEFWGWANGDTCQRTYVCCGHQMVIRLNESGDWLQYAFRAAISPKLVALELGMNSIGLDGSILQKLPPIPL